MWKFSTVLLLLAFPPSVNNKETPTPRMCTVCLENDCATGVRRIYPAGSDRAVWPNANSQTAIQNCSMENLKPGVPCKMANGSLVQLADNPLQFKGLDSSGEDHTFDSQISPCADLNLPPSSTPSPAHLAPMTKAPIHNTSTPAASNISVADKGIIISSVIGIIIIIIIIAIGVLIWMRNSRGQGQDGDHRHGNNGVPPHDAEDRDENTMEMQPLNAEVANGNINGVH